MKHAQEEFKNDIITAEQEQPKLKQKSPKSVKTKLKKELTEELKITRNIVEEKAQRVKEKEILAVRVDFESIKTHSKAISTETGSSKIKPSTYDGHTSLKTYRLQFEVASKTNNWNVEKKAKALDLICSAVHQKQRKVIMIITSFSSALALHFREQHLQQLFQAQPKSRKEQVEETLQKFEIDVRRLTHMAYPSA